MALGPLTREQNVKSAEVFLNIFGLKLEKKDKLNKNSKLTISDSIGDPVGELYFDGEYIKLKTLSPFGVLKAEYKRSFYNVGFDIMSGGLKYCDWDSSINFEIYKNRDEKYKGTFITEASINENGTRSINALALLDYLLDEESIAHVDFTSFGNVRFVMTILDEVGFDQIVYKSNLLTHKRSTEDGGDVDYHIFEDDGEIVVENSMAQDGKEVYAGDLDREIAQKDDQEKTKQMIKLMHRHDTSLKRRVNEARSIFTANNCDLLSNTIGVCSPLNDENLFEYLDVPKPSLTYQNGSDNLRDAYFGKDDSEFTLAPKMRRTLKRKF